MVISNKERSPGNLSYGKHFTSPIPCSNRPGMIFYIDEGTENGGLISTGGKESIGKYQAFRHFSFDQYNQNQVLYLHIMMKMTNKKLGYILMTGKLYLSSRIGVLSIKKYKNCLTAVIKRRCSRNSWDQRKVRKLMYNIA